VRFRVASGMGQRFHRATELERVADTIVALASRTDVYVGVIPRRLRGGARGHLIGVARVVWADCDTLQSASALTAFRLRPAMVVASGSGENCHAYWFLDEPAELECVEHLNRRLALALGADGRSADAARILRPAGSLNRKHSPPVPVGLLELRAGEVTLADLERNLPEEAATESASRPSRWRARGEPVDRLLLVSPAVYVQRLTGQHVGRSRKVHCPDITRTARRACTPMRTPTVAGIASVAGAAGRSMTSRRWCGSVTPAAVASERCAASWKRRWSRGILRQLAGSTGCGDD